MHRASCLGNESLKQARVNCVIEHQQVVPIRGQEYAGLLHAVSLLQYRNFPSGNLEILVGRPYPTEPQRFHCVVFSQATRYSQPAGRGGNMFCSGCGRTLEQGQVVCPQCNRPVAPQLPPVPGYEFVVAALRQQNQSARHPVAGLCRSQSDLRCRGTGIATQFFPAASVPGRTDLAPVAHGFLPRASALCLGVHGGPSILAAVAGWGLLERTQWGRIVAIVASILNLFISSPSGLALGIATLIILLGDRNWSLYEEL